MAIRQGDISSILEMCLPPFFMKRKMNIDGFKLKPGTKFFKIWAAAWLDTEGYICLVKRKNTTRHKTKLIYLSYALQVGIVQKEILPLLILQNAYGGNLVKAKKNPIVYRLQFSANTPKKLLKETLPYLLIKKEKAIQALKFLKHIKKKPRIGKNLCVKKLNKHKQETLNIRNLMNRKSVDSFGIENEQIN